MDRRDILAERPLESGRGFMPGVSVKPVESALHRRVDRQRAGRESRRGRHGAQARRAFERLQGVLSRADARFDNVIKQLVYVDGPRRL